MLDFVFHIFLYIIHVHNFKEVTMSCCRNELEFKVQGKSNALGFHK